MGRSKMPEGDLNAKYVGQGIYYIVAHAKISRATAVVARYRRY